MKLKNLCPAPRGRVGVFIRHHAADNRQSSPAGCRAAAAAGRLLSLELFGEGADKPAHLARAVNVLLQRRRVAHVKVGHQRDEARHAVAAQVALAQAELLRHHDVVNEGVAGALGVRLREDPVRRLLASRGGGGRRKEGEGRRGGVRRLARACSRIQQYGPKQHEQRMAERGAQGAIQPSRGHTRAYVRHDVDGSGRLHTEITSEHLDGCCGYCGAWP